MTNREQIRRRFLGPLPIAEWGPKCHGCGAVEFRIDGYCSVECRDYHDDDDVRDLFAELEQAELNIDHGQRLLEVERYNRQSAEAEADRLAEALRKIRDDFIGNDVWDVASKALDEYQQT
jgi:hypothetical protein